MVLKADKKDYKKAYKKHYEAYNILYRNNDCIISRRLLLVYSVECGLKYKLLNEWRVNNPEKIFNNVNDPRHGVIKSHCLKKILKELGQAGTFRFPKNIKTQHGQGVDDVNYHEMCRYGVEAKREYEDLEKSYEELLCRIAKWIEGEL